jgi:hypothetical protein
MQEAILLRRVDGGQLGWGGARCDGSGSGEMKAEASDRQEHDGSITRAKTTYVLPHYFYEIP